VFRKFLVKSLAALGMISMAVAGSVNVASAAVTFVGPTTISSTMNLVTVIPKDDQSSILIWRDGATSPNMLKSSILQTDGTVSNTGTIFSNSGNDRYTLSAQNAWTRLPDGTIAITWTTFNFGTGMSTLKVAYSDDGVEWSDPIQPETGYQIDQNAMCEPDCGYTNAQIASDGIGNLAVQFTFETDFRHAVQMAQTSRGGKSWAPAVEIGQAAESVFATALIGLPTGGFLSSWDSVTQSDQARFTARTLGSFLNVWTSPKVISTGYQVNSGSLFVQTGPFEYALIYVTSPSDADRYVAVARRFSTITKIWNPEQRIVVTGAAGWLNSDVVASVSPDGTVGVALIAAANGLQESKIHFNTFKGEVIGTKTIPVTISEQGSGISVLSATKDGNFTIVYDRLNGAVTAITVAQGVVTASLDMPFADGQTNELVSAVSPNGNIFAVSVRSQLGQFIGALRAGNPSFRGTPGVIGKFKKGSKLTANVLNFEGVSGFGTRAYQWYACSRAVPQNTFALPSGCVAIANAKTPQFILTSKQKGKYITVATSSSNALGQTFVFAPSSTKAK
jgi:hypothetical protein